MDIPNWPPLFFWKGCHWMVLPVTSEEKRRLYWWILQQFFWWFSPMKLTTWGLTGVVNKILGFKQGKREFNLWIDDSQWKWCYVAGSEWFCWSVAWLNIISASSEAPDLEMMERGNRLPCLLDWWWWLGCIWSARPMDAEWGNHFAIPLQVSCFRERKTINYSCHKPQAGWRPCLSICSSPCLTQEGMSHDVSVIFSIIYIIPWLTLLNHITPHKTI